MMTEQELLTVIRCQLSDTIKYGNGDFGKTNQALFRSYNQEPYGNEEAGHSQVITSDHYDLVESDMPALARIFLGPNVPLEFKPFHGQDEEEAQQKTQYADWLIRKQKDSFKILHDWMKEPGFSKCSVIKFYCDEEERAEYHAYQGLSADEITLQLESLDSEDVARVEIAEQDEKDDIYNVKFRVVKMRKRIKLANVPVESFILSRGASNKDEAMMIGDECRKTKGELIAEGHPKDKVKGLPACAFPDGSEAKHSRFKDQGGWDYQSGYHWTQEQVVIQNLYPLVDYDEDGIPERRYIVKCGDEILSNEPYGIAPYAILSQVLMPHNAIGRSRGEQAARYQKEKTAIKRGIMDNIYSVNRPRIAVDDSEGTIDGGKVDLDDLAVHRINGYVRVDGSPHQALMPLTVPYIGDSALQIVQYLETEKSATLGTTATNQGMSADKFYRETATRFEGVQDSQQAKIELVARVYAETGLRELYEGVIWTAQHYQDEETEIMVLGEPLRVDPGKWRYEHYCFSNVGIGAGDSAEAIDNLAAQFQTQLMLQQAGSPLVDMQKIFNTLDDLVRAMGRADTSRYYNNPDVKQQQLLPMLEKLMRDNQQLMQAAQNNPLAEAETIKAQARLMGEQNKRDIRRSELLQERELQMEKMTREDRQKAAQLAKELTELELKYGQNVPGSAV